MISNTKLKPLILFLIFLLLLSGGYYALLVLRQNAGTQTLSQSITEVLQKPENIQPLLLVHPLSIEYMREKTYPGSEITIEQELNPGTNYQRFVASYKSDGFKINSLLTIPTGEPPANGWPVIIFNHGYIPPEQYITTQKYVAYQDGFARSGYITLKSDYRGHGDSEGLPEGAYFSPAYTIDVLNAVESVKTMPEADSENIGMWGHSLGGHITLRVMVTTRDVKVGVIWSGVVASYADMLENWSRRSTWRPSPRENMARRPSRQELTEEFGTTDENSKFWDSISPITFVEDISGPVQIHHATGDATVPVSFSELLDKALVEAGQESELFIYQGDDHNISQNLGVAIQRSVAFFDTYLKPSQ